MSELSPKERVLTALRLKDGALDRIPVIGACQTATLDQMDRTGARWPDAHTNAEQMARLAMAIHTMLGFDAVRMPFCQTTEAVALGCLLKNGGEENIPHASPNPGYRLGDDFPLPDDFLMQGNIPVLIEAVRLAKKELRDRVAIIGGIIGPFTIAGAIMGTSQLAKASFKNPQLILPLLETTERAGTLLALALLEAGADIICVEDMAGSPDLIGPSIYTSLVAPYEKRQFAQIPAPTILHICGNTTRVLGEMADTGATAISYEEKVDTAAARQLVGNRVALICGPNAGITLFDSAPEDVERECRQQIELGVDILAPGCAVVPSTPARNLSVMLEAARKYGARGEG